jgi:hypothetical protein
VQVGNRWDEFTQQEQTQVATLSYSMLKEGAQGARWEGHAAQVPVPPSGAMGT